MSYNIRRDMGRWAWHRSDRWSVRGPRLQALLGAERPQLLAAQEATADQTRFTLASLGAEYRSIGYGRNAAGRGEGCPIFFDADRLELLDWYQQALSETPEVPGSRSWGNPFPRITVCADFRDLSTGVEFRIINTHLDPLSRGSRLRCAEAIRTQVEAARMPVLVTGDFNAAPDSRTAQMLRAGEALHDAWDIAEQRLTPEYATFAGYRAPRPGSRIDWVMVTPGVVVTHIGINAERFQGGWASDHLPVQAVIDVDPEESA